MSRKFTLFTQHNTTQHNTTQHNTTQHNTTQHNTTSPKIERKRKLVRKSQIVQSVIYISDAVVTQVLPPAVLSLGSQLGLFPFAEYERTKT